MRVLGVLRNVLIFVGDCRGMIRIPYTLHLLLNWVEWRRLIKIAPPPHLPWNIMLSGSKCMCSQNDVYTETLFCILE